MNGKDIQPLRDCILLRYEKAGWFQKDKEDWKGLVEKRVRALQEKNGENTGDEVYSLLDGNSQEVRST